METADYRRVEKVIRYLGEHHREQPSLEELAKLVSLSPSHFHRMFARWAGTTPKDFLQYLTAEHAKQLLSASKDVLHTALESGLSGPGRLHELLISVEALSPGEFKRKGEGIEVQYGFHESPFGLCLLGVTPRGIGHLAFVEDGNEEAAMEELFQKWPKATFKKSQRGTSEAACEVFARKRKQPLSVLLSGTPFQQKVWEALLRIPFGTTSSYGAIAKGLGIPKASRAVGSAVGDNTIGYLIPCHRVLRETGIVGAYRWGTPRKQALLAWEAATKEGDFRAEDPNS